MFSTISPNQTVIYLDLTNAEAYTVAGLPPAGTPLANWLTFAYLLYSLGLLGMVTNSKNFLITMMSIELMYLGAITSFVVLSSVAQNSSGIVYALTLLILAACESAIGLGIIIVLYRFGHTIDFNALEELGG